MDTKHLFYVVAAVILDSANNRKSDSSPFPRPAQKLDLPSSERGLVTTFHITEREMIRLNYGSKNLN